MGQERGLLLRQLFLEGTTELLASALAAQIEQRIRFLVENAAYRQTTTSKLVAIGDDTVREHFDLSPETQVGTLIATQDFEYRLAKRYWDGQYIGSCIQARILDKEETEFEDIYSFSHGRVVGPKGAKLDVDELRQITLRLMIKQLGGFTLKNWTPEDALPPVTWISG
ncbi:MAG: hypothetical protein Q7S79_00090 [bacterium]|nr:hypothetical protein [bacterium]